jgi:hypothetical protein
MPVHSKPVEVYMPFVAETQDEKQFKVVMDRERWFQALMDEYRPDEVMAEAIARRIPLPRVAVRELSFKLEVAVPTSRESGS